MISHKSRNQVGLTRLYFWSAVVCTLISFFGPFAWKIYSYEGLVYFFAVEAIFWLGLLCGSFFVVGTHSRRKRAEYIFNQRGYAAILLMVSIVSIVACLYLLVKFRAYYGASYQFGEASYEFAEEGRGIVEKICTVFLQFGMASYLLGLYSGCNQHGLRKAISLGGFWTTSLYYTMSGSRFTIVVGLIVFVVANRRQSIRVLDAFAAHVQKGWQKLAAVLLVVVVLVALGAITSTRMSVDSRIPQNHYEFVPGDSPLKAEWVPFAEYEGSSVNAAFSIFDYIGEAPFVFSAFYDFYMPEKVYFAENTLRSIGQFLRPIGINLIHSQSSIYAEIGGGSGKYSGFAYTLIVDFGKYLAPFVAFLIGFLFSKIEKHREDGPFFAALYPCVVASVVFAPIYYFYVGRLDFVLMGLLVLEALRHLMIRKRNAVVNEKSAGLFEGEHHEQCER